MDVWFCKGRNHGREALMRAGIWVINSCALLESARQQKCVFSRQSTTWKSGRIDRHMAVLASSPDWGRTIAERIALQCSQLVLLVALLVHVPLRQSLSAGLALA